MAPSKKAKSKQPNKAPADIADERLSATQSNTEPTSSAPQPPLAGAQGSWIQLRGVRVHNLQNVDVDLPKGQMIAVCGVSGSGKTSLAIDTLYAEGQRRYIESFSAYTRQFLERLDKPDYDRIDGLTPALAVTRGSAPRGNRSTVGTASETLDYLRLLYSKVAQLVCYGCGRTIEPASAQTTASLIQRLPEGLKLMVCFTMTWEDVTERAMVLAELQQTGLIRLIASERMLNLSDDRELLGQSLAAGGSAQVVVDRLRGGELPSRSNESLETAFNMGLGEASLLVEASDKSSQQAVLEQLNGLAPNTVTIDNQIWFQIDFANKLICAQCKIDYPPPSAQLFSFNSPLGACPKCEGFGDTVDLDMDLVVPDRKKTLREGAIAPWNSPSYSPCLDELLDQAKQLGIPADVPFSKLTDKQVSIIRDGDAKSGYGGLAAFFGWLERKKYKMHVRVFLSRWRSYNRCDQCKGQRLKPEALAYKVAARSVAELCSLPVAQLKRVLSEELSLDDRQQKIAHVPLDQLNSRLGFLELVGLGYLTLDRTLRTLSGGESQRTALTSALGSSLVNMLYVLDEPSVGLHPHDVEQLAKAIDTLKGRGNTVVIIEHEEVLLDRADWIIEVGPAAGSSGGQIVFSGPRARLNDSKTLTGDYLSGKRIVPTPQQVRKPSGWLKLTGCRGNNLKNIDVEFPLGVLCLVTGVSGSGKSSLIQDTLYNAIANRLTKSKVVVLPFENLIGLGQIDECLMVDQSPVGRSPRSNPVTFVKAFDEIRHVFAEQSDAKLRGYTAGHFSFNSELGRCSRCEGDGALQIDMQFLADIFMSCPDCKGSRYRHDILQVRYRDHSIADVLNLTVRDALNFFRGQLKVQQKLEVLASVGLDYLQLGQSATTLSAGEGQRLKLAGYLASATKKKTLFILDEPTTGLHTHDIVQLLDCFDALLAAGHSLIVVEHNVHLMAAADYIIDIGPGPAELGGRIVACGTPAEVSKSSQSVTARYIG
jgi:excinuclease ABC subunit A